MNLGRLVRQSLLTWLAIYPVITLLLWLLGPSIAGLPLMVRTLILTVIMVPVMVFALVPALTATVGPLLGLDRPSGRSGQ
jgi:antibiotic biosynthesis monooxygenase (ABM) superfamily enzyme